MRLLLLGGAQFLGRAVADAALARRHELTFFNRGRTNPELYPEAEKLRGDRDGGLDALVGRDWDAVVDTCGYFPRLVRASAELLEPHVDRYAFISSVSVYGDFSGPVDESSAVGTLEDETVEEWGENGENYGPLKALCERVVQETYGERAGDHLPQGRRLPVDRDERADARGARVGHSRRREQADLDGRRDSVGATSSVPPSD